MGKGISGTLQAEGRGATRGRGLGDHDYPGDIAGLPAKSTKYQVVFGEEDINKGCRPTYGRDMHSMPGRQTYPSHFVTISYVTYDLPLNECLEAREFAI